MILQRPIETKVKAATTASPIAFLIALAIVHYVPWLKDQSELLTDAIAAALGALGAFAAGYLAAHTPRPATPKDEGSVVGSAAKGTTP